MMPPPGPVSPKAHERPVIHAVGTVVVVVGTVVFRVTIFVDVFAGYLLVFAIFNVNVHDEPVPIVSCVGLLFGDKVHEPVFDHVFTPGEFVVAIADRLLI